MLHVPGTCFFNNFELRQDTACELDYGIKPRFFHWGADRHLELSDHGYDVGDRLWILACLMSKVILGFDGTKLCRGNAFDPAKSGLKAARGGVAHGLGDFGNAP